MARGEAEGAEPASSQAVAGVSGHVDKLRSLGVGQGFSVTAVQRQEQGHVAVRLDLALKQRPKGSAEQPRCLGGLKLPTHHF